jgi:glycosyltransferase 2 family protein
MTDETSPHTQLPRFSGPVRSTISRRWILLAIKLFVSVGLLVVLFRQTDVSSVTARMRDMDLRWMATAVAIYAGMIALSAWRWRVLIETQQVTCSLSQLGGSFLVATFFNNFLPSNIGGDVVRVADTAPIMASRTRAAAVVLIDRGLGLIALILVAAIGSLAAHRHGLDLPGSGYLWIALGGTVAAALPPLFAPAVLFRALAPIHRLFRSAWVDERVGRLAHLLMRLNDRPGALAQAFVGAIGVQLIIVLFYAVVARGLDIPLTFAGALLIVPISLVVQMAPVSINGFGVREAVFTYFFGRLGLSVDAALALSLISTATIAIFSLSGGLLFLLRRRGLSPAPLPSDSSN